MLPLSLLRAATGSPLLVELKGGDTYNGRLVSCDSWMNMNLRDVICTSKDGDRFWKLPSCYIRGSAIKYLRLPPDLLEKAEQQDEEDAKQYAGRGGGEGRGRGGGRGYRGGGNRGGGRGGGGGRGRSGGRGRDGGGGRGGGRGRSGSGDGGGGRGEGGGRGGRSSNYRGSGGRGRQSGRKLVNPNN